MTSGGYRPVNTVISTTSTAYSWNVTIPSLNGLSVPTIIAILPGDVILAKAVGSLPEVQEWKIVELRIHILFGQLAISHNPEVNCFGSEIYSTHSQHLSIVRARGSNKSGMDYD